MNTSEFIETLQELLLQVDYKTICATYGLTHGKITADIVGIAYKAYYTKTKASDGMFECEVKDRQIEFQTILTRCTAYNPLPF